jgi:hypothetical protein
MLRDLVRFGALADYQIARRYTAHANPRSRIRSLTKRGLMVRRRERVEGARVFIPTRACERLLRPHVRLPARRKPTSENHVRHNLAVVDLADALLESNPDATWITERELDTRASVSTDPGHKPDGLLIVGNRRIAIELEQTPKDDFRYDRICRWFACATRIDGIHWYVSTDSLLSRVQAAVDRHGLIADGLDVRVERMPRGVEVRPWES